MDTTVKATLRRICFLASVWCFVGTAFAASIPDTLRDAAQKAISTNPEVQAQWHAFRAVEASQDSARGGYFPRLDLNAGSTQYFRDRPKSEPFDYTQSGASLTLTQMVFDGFYTSNEVSRLEHAKRVRYYDILGSAENAALEAVRAYADVLRYRDLVSLAKENYVEHRRIHDQIAQRTGAGVGRKVDLEQATGRLALAESNLLTEVSNLHDVSARYLRVVGEQAPDTIPEIKGGLVASTELPATSQDALTQAMAGNPALRAAIENVRMAHYLVEARHSANLPRVDVRASQGITDNLDDADGQSSDAAVGVVLSYNLFRGGSDQADIREANEVLSQSKSLRDKACREVRQALSIAHHDSQKLGEQLHYYNQHRQAIARARTAYRKQFDIGQRSLLDLLDTENEYYQARRAYVGAYFDLIHAQGRTLAGMGKLLSTLNVTRNDLPQLEAIDMPEGDGDFSLLCPPEAPAEMMVDKQGLLDEAMLKASSTAVDLEYGVETGN